MILVRFCLRNPAVSFIFPSNARNFKKKNLIEIRDLIASYTCRGHTSVEYGDAHSKCDIGALRRQVVL